MARKTHRTAVAQGKMAQAGGVAEARLSAPAPDEPDLFSARPSEPAALDAQAALTAEGHRSRMRARLLAAGPDSLADHEMLEMLLFLALPRKDTKPIARALLGRFGGLNSSRRGVQSEVTCRSAPR